MSPPDPSSQLEAILAADSGVDPAYRHGPKRVSPGRGLETEGSVLKWYHLHAEDHPVPETIDRLARTHLLGGPPRARGLGFVILHRCGGDFYFLIVCTWRGSNEIWQTVFYKDGERMAEFALWPREEEHKPTFCVWELGPVWHEQQAWRRFLWSARGPADARAWRESLLSGIV